MLKTLLEYAGVELTPGKIEGSILMIIDAQNEYFNGDLSLPGVSGEISEIFKLLNKAREVGAPIIHVVHQSKAGASLFDPEKRKSHIIDKLRPINGEKVIIKKLPNAFTGTELQKEIESIGCKSLIVVGFMTHLCISSTVRAAMEMGYKVTVVANACATRNLEGHDGSIIPANIVHNAELAALRDRFACVVERAEDLG